MKKRGQMEMIGLVIIVILITLGMLFMAKFALQSEPKKKIFVRKGLAYSGMGALMKTSVDCEVPYGDVPYEKALTIGGDLIEDCASYIDRPYSEIKCGGYEHSCKFLNKTIGQMLNDTLGKWNKHYEFNSSLLGFGEQPTPILVILDEDGLGCPKERDSSGLFPINTDAGLIENILYLCD